MVVIHLKGCPPKIDLKVLIILFAQLGDTQNRLAKKIGFGKIEVNDMEWSGIQTERKCLARSIDRFWDRSLVENLYCQLAISQWLTVFRVLIQH